MIDPTDFHKTAEYLKDERDEWHVRTVINRSYYGLFLFCRELLSGHGVKLPDRRKKSPHQFIIECFEESKKSVPKSAKGSKRKSPSKDDDKIMIGQIWKRLSSLFQDRIDADYRLDLRFPPSYSQDSLGRAQTVLRDLKDLRGSAVEKHIIDTARIHAEKVTLLAEARR